MAAKFPCPATVNKPARIQLAEEMGYRRLRAILLNISSDGALVLMEEKPVLHGKLWIRLEKPMKTDWISAIPVRFDQFHEVEIRFSHPCPPAFLWAATCGNDFCLVENNEEELSTRLG
jgi:hypothetical protein